MFYTNPIKSKKLSLFKLFYDLINIQDFIKLKSLRNIDCTPTEFNTKGQSSIFNFKNNESK